MRVTAGNVVDCQSLLCASGAAGTKPYRAPPKLPASPVVLDYPITTTTVLVLPAGMAGMGPSIPFPLRVMDLTPFST